MRDIESEIGYNFDTKGSRPYSFELTVKADHDGQGKDYLSSVRSDIDSWERHNVHRL